MKALICLFRAAVISTVIFAQIGATPAPKPVPYNVNLYLHPQRLVDIGGRRLNIVCTGQGSPTVILEGDSSPIPASGVSCNQPFRKTPGCAHTIEPALASAIRLVLRATRQRLSAICAHSSGGPELHRPTCSLDGRAAACIRAFTSIVSRTRSWVLSRSIRILSSTLLATIRRSSRPSGKSRVNGSTNRCLIGTSSTTTAR